MAAIAWGIGGLAAARIAGLVMDRPKPVMYALAAAETVTAVSAVMALAAATNCSGDIYFGALIIQLLVFVPHELS